MDAAHILERFVREDLAGGDPTGELLPDVPIRAEVVARRRGVVSGTRHAAAIFGMRRCDASIVVPDGEVVEAGGTVMGVRGRAADVLALERTALNLLSRMSGIATISRDLASRLPPGVRLLSTRKTAPGLREFDKEAVEAGGGFRHRMGLGDMIMIKDNHIAAARSLDGLVREAARRGGRFEVEADAPADALRAARLGAPVIMLDNFTPDMIQETVSALEAEGLRGAVELEASGGITLENIAEYGRSGVDCVSVGYMTNSAPCLDMGLDVR